METATDRGSAATFVADLCGVAADSLRGTVTERVITFRESFPMLPASAEVRAEKPYTVRLARGAVELCGVPELVLGRATARERRVLLVDLKTGNRSGRHLHDMRFYALLATLATGVAPFGVLRRRGGLGARGHRPSSPRGRARTVAAKIERAGELVGAPPPADGLRLEPGPACGWCTRSPLSP